MSRPLRIEYPGAIHHVTSRSDRRELIFGDDEDRPAFLAVVDQARDRFDAKVLAYCLLGNHYHFVLLTRQEVVVDRAQRQRAARRRDEQRRVALADDEPLSRKETVRQGLHDTAVHG